MLFLVIAVFLYQAKQLLQWLEVDETELVDMDANKNGLYLVKTAILHLRYTRWPIKRLLVVFLPLKTVSALLLKGSANGHHHRHKRWRLSFSYRILMLNEFSSPMVKCNVQLRLFNLTLLCRLKRSFVFLLHSCLQT